MVILASQTTYIPWYAAIYSSFMHDIVEAYKIAINSVTWIVFQLKPINN